MTGKKILITGYDGFIGRHLVNRLKNSPGVTLILKGRHNITLVTHSGTKSIKVSLADIKKGVWKRLGVDQIDLIFHLGSFTPKSSSDGNFSSKIIADNIHQTQRLLDSLPPKTQKIIYTSTLDVYQPPTADTLLNESSSINPTSVYGASKFFCETLIKNFAENKQINYTILRYGHIYGPGEEHYSKFIPATMLKLLKNESPIIYGDGNALRDFLYVDDAIEATIRAAHSHIDPGPINIVYGKSTTIRSVAETIIEVMDNNIGIKYIPDQPRGPSYRFSNIYMKKTLGKWPLVDLKDGLTRELKYLQAGKYAER